MSAPIDDYILRFHTEGKKTKPEKDLSLPVYAYETLRTNRERVVHDAAGYVSYVTGTACVKDVNKFPRMHPV